MVSRLFCILRWVEDKAEASFPSRPRLRFRQGRGFVSVKAETALLPQEHLISCFDFVQQTLAQRSNVGINVIGCLQHCLGHLGLH